MSPSHALIIDDNRLNIDVIAMILSQEGVDSTAVEYPTRLSGVLEQLEKIDVVFLDLEFPNENGFRLLEQLKADPRIGNAPIVAYTVHTSSIDDARRAGFHSFIGKPISSQRFPGQLKRILSGIPVWEA
jgi:two-component system, cell cycle response regulator DivK